MLRNCFGYQDLRQCQHRFLVCLARVYDVVGTSVGPAHRASVGIVDTSDHCPGTFAPLLQRTDLELERPRAHNRSGGVDGPRAGSFELKALALGR